MRKSILMTGALLVVMLGTSGPVTAASVLRVPQDYPTIQGAIDAAISGDTVRVSPGVYVELIDNDSKEIAIESTGGASVTTIDGGLGGVVVRLIANPGETPVLRGFTVQNGYESSAFGGGVFTYGGPALIEDNVVSSNYSCSGGIYVNFSGATVRNNVVSGTRPNCSGGSSAGIHIGGAGTSTITGNLITGNVGGISLFAAGSPTIGGNTVTGNTGFGIDLVNQSNALIVNNVIARNTGSGISWLVPLGEPGPTVVSNTIAGNGASAIFADGFDRSTRVFNNVLVGIAGQTVVNCGNFNDLNPPILEFNDVLSTGTGSRYGGICSDQTGVNGNISADPLFSGTSDFHLQFGSPAIDAGTPVGAPSTDIEGIGRPRDGNADGVPAWDIGAYEFRPSDTFPPVITLPGDIAVDAAGPAGAVVSYTAIATDDVDGRVPVTCTPPSGSVFSISDTLVECAATDSAGNTANTSFTVHVKGAPEQVAALIALVDSYNLRLLGTALHDKLVKVQEFLASNKPKRACERLDSFLAQVKEQRGKRLSIEQADRLTRDARRIKAVIGC